MNNHKKYKFSNRKTTFRLAILIALISFIFVFFFNSIDSEFKSGLRNLSFGLTVFVGALIQYKQKKIGVEELVFADNYVKLYFYDSKLKPINVEINPDFIEINDNIIKFKDKNKNKLIGKAHKSHLREISLWDDLCKKIEK